MSFAAPKRTVGNAAAVGLASELRVGVEYDATE